MGNGKVLLPYFWVYRGVYAIILWPSMLSIFQVSFFNVLIYWYLGLDQIWCSKDLVEKAGIKMSWLEFETPDEKELEGTNGEIC